MVGCKDVSEFTVKGQLVEEFDGLVYKYSGSSVMPLHLYVYHIFLPVFYGPLLQRCSVKFFFGNSYTY